MILARWTVGPFAENVYAVGVAPRVALIDPGGESERIFAEVEEKGWEPEAILLTHAHLDHVAHATQVAERYGIGLSLHREDLYLLHDPQMPEYARMLGWERPPEPEGFFDHGDTLEVAGLTLGVIHTPGHTPGGVCFVHEESRTMVVGDTLFHRGIGRTDLPGGDYETLERSVKEVLFPLDGDYALWPGHGPETTLEGERRENPFFGARAVGARRF